MLWGDPSGQAQRAAPCGRPLGVRLRGPGPHLGWKPALHPSPRQNALGRPLRGRLRGQPRAGDPSGQAQRAASGEPQLGLAWSVPRRGEEGNLGKRRKESIQNGGDNQYSKWRLVIIQNGGDWNYSKWRRLIYIQNGRWLPWQQLINISLTRLGLRLGFGPVAMATASINLFLGLWLAKRPH